MVGEAIENVSSNKRGGELYQSMEGLREVLEDTMKDKKYMREVRESASGSMTKIEKVGFRKMMANYWSNSLPFALDLVGAVVRQGGFIEKMHNIDWLHSPALPSTMTRLVVKYNRYLQILAVNDGAFAVPGGDFIQDPEWDVQVKLKDLQADPNNPLYSIKSFNDLQLYEESFQTSTPKLMCST